MPAGDIRCPADGRFSEKISEEKIFKPKISNLKIGKLMGLFLSALLALILTAAFPARASEPIKGTTSVIDGDTVEIHGQRIRLYGIDAPESRQNCKKDGNDWRCGKDAAFALADKIGANPIECEPKTKHDHYGRTVAICRLDGEDLNGWMVSQGWALAYKQYSLAYVPHENESRDAKRGVWASKFTPPWEWRRNK